MLTRKIVWYEDRGWLPNQDSLPEVGKGYQSDYLHSIRVYAKQQVLTVHVTRLNKGALSV